jgi:Fic family protein
MRTFDYATLSRRLLDGRAAELSVEIYQDKGKMELLRQMHPDVFEGLEEAAHFENVDASFRIEGMLLDRDRLRDVVAMESKAWPEIDRQAVSQLSEEEAQAYGYSHALRVVERDAAGQAISSGTAVRFLEDLLCGRLLGHRSRYRKKGYLYTLVDGHMQAVPASPIVAFETPLVFGGSCDALADAFGVRGANPLAMIPVFTVDLLCIRPFDEGNGRVARLMAMLLLETAGFDVYRYQSVDRIFEEDVAGYYEALNACAEGWDTERNDYAPFVEHWMAAVHDAYCRLFDNVELRVSMPSSKTQRVRAFVERAGGPVRKRDIVAANPDISVSTIENALGQLVREGAVRKVGAGRSTAYEAVRSE